MDGRTTLKPGTTLKLSTKTGYTAYSIHGEIGRGGSCIVYDASYSDNLGNYKLVRIKECYPYAARIIRDQNNCLVSENRDETFFVDTKQRMMEAYQKNHALFMTEGLANTVSNTSNIYEANGTIYIVSTWLHGRTFADAQGKTLHECASLVLSAAKVLKQIHDAGYLYLDLKPENILTIDGTLDLVQLFDFDSMISVELLKEAIKTGDATVLRSSYTKGYAPLEQQTGKLKQIGKHSDLFSLGAVLFYALWHRTPSAFDCDEDAEYDFRAMAFPYDHYQNAVFRELTIFFHKSLASYHGDRYQDSTEAIEQLKVIIALSDEKNPWIRSTIIPDTPCFYGREQEIDELSALLENKRSGIVNLYGMGGIGKSTLARRYIANHRDAWDAIVWLDDQENMDDLMTDDKKLSINMVRRMQEESTEEYLQRKMSALAALAHDQQILLVLDNFKSNHLEQLKKIEQVGWTVLLISRERLPEGMFPSKHLERMNDQELAYLFKHYSHCDLNDDENLHAFYTIVSVTGGHTLLTELIARQIAKSYLNLQEAEAMLTGIGFSDLPEEKIDYIRDQSAYHDTLMRILDRLIEIDKFTEQNKLYMKLLSLFDIPGIEASLFRELTQLSTLDFINELETAGWLKMEQGRLYLHPLMQEYIRTWQWSGSMTKAADDMMRKLYEMIRPAGQRHDGSKQFPRDYGCFYNLLSLADQLIEHTEWISESSQLLLFRILIDAPVDHDTMTLLYMLDLLRNPKYLDDDCVLRLYETAAYLRARLYAPEDAIEILKDMRRYLRKHPSAYYLSAYHQAMAVILHNENSDLRRCINHQNHAIAAARVSSHPDAKKQLASCLLNKARTLMSAGKDQKQVRNLVQEAEPLVMRYTEPLDYERYQFVCNAAMCYAMDGDISSAQKQLDIANQIAFEGADSDLSIAEHLIEEVAPIRMEMSQFDLAEEAILKAVEYCEKHQDARRYREVIFDAYYFLGRVCAMNEEYSKSQWAYGEAEKRVNDWPYEMTLPLCPEEVRQKAKTELHQ